MLLSKKDHSRPVNSKFNLIQDVTHGRGHFTAVSFAFGTCLDKKRKVAKVSTKFAKISTKCAAGS